MMSSNTNGNGSHKKSSSQHHHRRDRKDREDRVDRGRHGRRSRSRDREYSRNREDEARRHMNREYDERHSSNPSPSYKTKGRGHGRDGSLNENISVSVESPIQSNMEYPYNSRLCNVGVYESIGESGSFRGTGPQRSVNGWALFVTNIHEEAQEDDVIDLFSEFGKVQSVVLNRDRKTGRAKGYALVEFGEYTEAQDAINALHGKEFLGKVLGVDYAFVKPADCRSHSSVTYR